MISSVVPRQCVIVPSGGGGGAAAAVGAASSANCTGSAEYTQIGRSSGGIDAFGCCIGSSTASSTEVNTAAISLLHNADVVTTTANTNVVVVAVEAAAAAEMHSSAPVNEVLVDDDCWTAADCLRGGKCDCNGDLVDDDGIVHEDDGDNEDDDDDDDNNAGDTYSDHQHQQLPFQQHHGHEQLYQHHHEHEQHQHHEQHHSHHHQQHHPEAHMHSIVDGNFVDELLIDGCTGEGSSAGCSSSSSSGMDADGFYTLVDGLQFQEVLVP